MGIINIKKYEIKAEGDLFALRDVWEVLEKGEEMTTFQTFEWHRLLMKEWTGWKLHALYSRCFVYVASNQNGPVMLMPVILYKFSTQTKWFGAKKGIYFQGQGSYSDYMNVVCLDFSAKVFEAICDEMKRDFPGNRIYLTSVREDASLCHYLKGKDTPCFVSTVALAAKKQESVEAYEASLSKNTRAKLRKALNRMERENLDYQMEIMGPIQDMELLKQMVDIHVRRVLIKNTKHEGVLHVLSSYVRKAYRKYRDLHNNIIAMCMHENPNSVIILIRLNGELVGYQFGVREAHSIRMLQTCFDEKFAFYIPLFRGTYDFIRKTYEDETLLEVDFTRGDEEYKYRLGGQEISLYDFTIA